MDLNGKAKREEMQDQQWDSNDNKNSRGSRSRSPLEKMSKNRSRDSSPNRNSSRTRNRSRSPHGGRRQRAPTNRRVYVANIPYDCKWTTVKDLFREKVGDVSYVELFEDEGGKFRGCGIVELKEEDSVQKAVDVLHRFEFKGRQLVVKEDFDVDRDKTGKPLGRGGNSSSGRRSGGDGRGGGDSRGGSNDRGDRDNYSRSSMTSNSVAQYDTYGLSPQFLDSLGISGPLTNRIFVANLDYKVSIQKLEEVFKIAGRVLKITLKKDEDGNSKGHGTIEMSHPVEAVQAISMFNGQRYFNRPMSVRMDKKHKDDVEDKRLPEGLQSVGKGLGANGLPLHLTNSSSSNMGNSGMNQLGLGSGGNLGLMQNSGLGTGVSPGAGGIPGLSGIGMGLGIGGSADRNIAGGLGSLGLSQGLGLGNSSGLGNPNLMGGSFGSGLGGGGGGLGSGLGSSLGSGLSVGGNTLGSGGGLGGYGDYDRGYDRDDYRRGGRSSDTIVVRNLPTSCTWQNLRDRFREIGDIRFTEMKGRGMAVIRYTAERDAQRAVDMMDHVRIEGRSIEVSLY